ncbi:MAG: hypothetical protein ACFE95_05200 [Candidatus Hodarchaeota archaeon]
MNLNNLTQQIKLWGSNNPKEVTTVFLAIGLFVSSFIIPIENGLYFMIVIAIIIGTILIGSVFLVYNTSVLAIAIFYQEGLSEAEKTWVNHRISRNIIIIGIWVTASVITFFLIGQILGIIASLFLITLLLIFRIAGAEENPFLEMRYEL